VVSAGTETGAMGGGESVVGTGDADFFDESAAAVGAEN